MLPLDDIRVLDFSFHLPGPLASLILAQAGASVIKVERPGTGDELRLFPPFHKGESLGFAMLNRGKRSVAIDLKAPDALARLRPLIIEADVIIDQFRPGVMDRLGLGYAALKAINPRLIYCAITGYGQSGPDRLKAGHDLNYVAETGLLSLGGDQDGAPVVPPVTIADIAGGSYPAVMNILLALRKRDRSGEGSFLDISMTDTLFALQYWAIAQGQSGLGWPGAGDALLTGGSARYALYRAADGRYLAVAPLEERFWTAFCDAIGLDPALRDDSATPADTRQAVARILGSRSAPEWMEILGDGLCCSIVRSVQEAVENPHFRERGLFARRCILQDGTPVTALDVPLCDAVRDNRTTAAAPAVGEDNATLTSSAPTQ